MLILTEALSDGLVLGYYVYGPSAKGSWDISEPAGYVNFAGKVSDNVLRFNSGKYPVEVRLSGANAITMQLTNPEKKSKLGSAARLWAAGRFTQERYAKETLTLLSEVLMMEKTAPPNLSS